MLTAFLLYVRRMYDPLDELAMFYNTYQSAAAALEKISGLLEEVPGVPEPADPVPLAGGASIAGDVRFDGVALRLPPGRAGAADAGPAHPGRPDRGRCRRHRRRQVDAGQVAGPVLRPDRRPGAAGRHRRRDRVAPQTCARRRDGHPGVVPVLRDPSPTTSRSGARRRRRRARSRRPRTRSAPARSSGRCRTGSTPTSASAAAGCPPVNGNWWRSPGRSWPIRRC